MGSDLYIAAAGAMARLRDLDIVANNLANSDTVGYKRDTAIFEVAMQAALQKPEGDAVDGGPGLSFVDTNLVATSFSPGPVRSTGGPLDVAIVGDGFFEVATAEGPRFTRAGSFAVNGEGQLSTLTGYPVAGDAGPIAVGGRSVEIRASGEVVDAEGNPVGRLQVVRFEDPGVLVKMGANLFRSPEDEIPVPDLDAQFVPRSLERSNVVPVKELSTLVMLQRAFELNIQALQRDDETTQSLLQELNS